MKVQGSKLINSTSFGESVFPAGFNLKSAKEDLNVKGKYGFPPQHLCGKALEGFRSHVTKAEGKMPPGGATSPVGRPISPRPTYQPSSRVGFPPPLSMHLGRCLSRFDPRAHIANPGLYNQPLPPSLKQILKP